MKAYENKQVVVLGLAKSGVAVAKLLHRFGAMIIVNDQKPREQATGVEELEALGIQVITGYHPDDLIHPGVSLVVKNPGIPYTAKPVAQAIELGIPVITEVEIASQLSKAPLIGITGSNGKTTTTTLVGLILKEAQVDSVVGGNIGTVLCSLAETMREDQYLVAELSSFQLMGTQTFRPHIGALLNLYQAHLDYHGTMDEYLAAKLKLFANQTDQDYAVLPYDQQVIREATQSISAQTYFFSIKQEVPQGTYVRDGRIVYKDKAGSESDVMAVQDVALPGEFNLENALAAITITRLAGADFASMARVLSSFTGVEHRLEYVATIDEVKYYNDSKATNPEAATKAITAFTTEPVVLIAGGLDRGIEFHELVPVFAKHVKAIVTYGQTKEILCKRAEEAGITNRVMVDTVDNAVIEASKLAQSGDVVLLSPACASWDMFPSFEVRGSMFKDGVHKLRNKPI
ncbi:UDP-N-acetylmuramoyl-L-alanine--D-glutamate ligase [Brevibacillus dissolubilis]|uniref:UDP-N-acetylmuramoyl-L-alanine--D-glutamate ligase n=1 Tax=Brevibacillus dissolubilis TaxID=1844116 RepID=UPI001116F0AF|nr:UDP-N-acetylmuramoyl-L-alanine--D-glutamate ligase [Brevibacillus dissolubilis]